MPSLVRLIAIFYLRYNLIRKLADLDEEALKELRASPSVEYIEEDGIMHTFATQ
jgi:hypothetical protein